MRRKRRFSRGWCMFVSVMFHEGELEADAGHRGWLVVNSNEVEDSA